MWAQVADTSQLVWHYWYDFIYELRHEKTGFLPMQKQRRRSAVQLLELLCSYCTADQHLFLVRLHKVHRAIAVTPVVHVPVRVRVPVRVTLALKFPRSPYLDNHSSESIHTWTIDTL